MEDAGNLQNTSNLSRKVVAVAAGEGHTLVVTGNGNVYSWGRGMFGRLGLGSESDELFPAQVKFGNPNGTGNTIKIVGVTAGAYHSLALAEDGSVWCWGYNIYGQLGNNGEDSNEEKFREGGYSLVPCLLTKFIGLHPHGSSTAVSEGEDKASLRICAVKAGGMMSLAIDNHGTLWMWGNCPKESKEGALSFETSFTPTPVWDFRGHVVVKVACGNEHVVALVRGTEPYNDKDLVCYSWGHNNHGQLGVGDTEIRLHPELVETFNEESGAIYEVACGAFHTALLTRKKKPANSSESICWTFGRGDNGQLGHGTTQSTLLPTPVQKLPQNVHLVSVDCGLFHTSVVSSAGDVWSWGMEKGLGLCPGASRAESDSGDALSPRLIPCSSYQPKFPDPDKVVCGAAHTVVVGQKGYKVWAWGRGRSGVLGNGAGVDCYTPTLVQWPPTLDNSEENETEAISETDEKLSSALNELKLLQTKLSMMEKYAGILHGSVFGKPFDEKDIPVSLQNSGSFDIAKEWDNMLEAADDRKLARLEMFYRNMLSGVKDKLMKRKIKEMIKECLQSSDVKN